MLGRSGRLASSDRWRITTFDNRGVGQSETPAGEYRITSFAEDTAALMDALGIERAHVVGSSMGGAIAQELALAHPDKVRSLVLNGTYCRGDHFFREVIRSWQWAAQKSDNLREFLNVVNLWCFAPRIYNEGIMEEWLTAAAASPHAQSVDAFCRSADALIEHDTYDRVGAICGADARDGRRARPLPARALRPRARRPDPGRELEVIAEQGHQPFQEGPAEYNALLAEFWSAVPAG